MVFLKISRDINTYHAEFGKDVKFRCKRMKAGDPKLANFCKNVYAYLCHQGGNIWHAFLCETLRNY